MLNYHHIIKWHEQYDPAMHVSEAEQDEPSAEATYNKNYIQQKLEHGLNRIWKVIDSLLVSTSWRLHVINWFKYCSLVCGRSCYTIH